MCPACLATAALIAAGTASAGGLTALVVKKFRKKTGANPLPTSRQKNGGNHESSKNRV